jgi:hypothetical protein
MKRAMRNGSPNLSTSEQYERDLIRQAIWFPAQVLIAWPGGPSRIISEVEHRDLIQMADGRFAGAYVCHRCHKPVHGVYGPDWRCGSCVGHANEGPRSAGAAIRSGQVVSRVIRRPSRCV